MRDILRRHSFSIAFLLILIVAVFFLGEDKGEIQRLSGFTMGTSFELQIVDMPEQLGADELAQQVNTLLRRLDVDIFSTYAANSELSRFNRQAVDEPFIASAQLLEVLLMAREISELTDGAFDVTVGPLVNLWGFGPVIGVLEQVPTADKITAALDSVGFEYLEIDAINFEVIKTRDIYVDLSAIAKGYAVDQLADYFDALGVENYFLEVGGELKIKGLKPGNMSWVPAIEAPVDVDSRVYEIFFSRGETIGVAGSGDYRNYFEADGVRYSHEIDPRSGSPVSHNLAAVYVISHSTARADALATAFMVLGTGAAQELADRENIAAYFISKTANGFSEYFTDGFAHYLGNNE